MKRREIWDEAKGRWPSILKLLGIPAEILDGKQHPCPTCGGKDRFRFDNGMEKGGSFCNACGARNGVQLIRAVHGWTFAEACEEVRKYLPQATQSKVIVLDDNKRRSILNQMWHDATPIVAGSQSGTYLASRNLPAMLSSELRHTDRCWISGLGEINYLQAMLARVWSPDGRPVSIHRTYLQGGRKAAIESPRRMMPGEVPAGSAVRLYPAGEELAVSEGIETALAVHRDTGLPCWSLVSDGGLRAFVPPEGVKAVRIYGDHDLNFVGQAAAFELGKRLRLKGIEATVHIPDRPGTDWADQAEALQESKG